MIGVVDSAAGVDEGTNTGVEVTTGGIEGTTKGREKFA